jgi:DNA-binding MarR family transcriptional regulator
MSKPTSARIEAVRRFSRFYTKQIGILDDGLPESPFSRTEGRVLCELAHHDTTSAGQLADALGIDAGYLSRILRSLEKRGVLLKTRSTLDRRQMLISLSGDGIKTLEALNTESRAQIARILSRMSPVQQKRTVDAMQTIESLLEVDPDSTRANVTLRPPGPGDMGWVVQRHGELYHDMRGWDATFEALVGNDRGQILTRLRPTLGTGLDRRLIRRTRGLDFSHATIQGRWPVANAPGRTRCERTRTRGPSCGRMCESRPTRRIQEDGFVYLERTRLSQTPLRSRGLPTRERGSGRHLGEKTHSPVVGADSMSASEVPEGIHYLLGHTEHELRRLEIQGDLYRDETRKGFLAAGMERGMRVLDIGC